MYLETYILQVEHLIGGMRGLKAMLWDASVLDPNEVSGHGNKLRGF
jgi:hypothetical protein